MSFLGTVGTVIGVLVAVGVVGALFTALLVFVSNAYRH